jgi:hypothetical protein
MSRGDRLSCWLDYSGTTRDSREADDEKWVREIPYEFNSKIAEFLVYGF